MRTIVGMTGASGSLFGVELLRRLGGEKYLIASRWGKSVLAQETGMSFEQVSHYATKVFSNEDLSSPFASGSNPFDAMVILPCSASTMAKIASGLGDSLLTRAASVTLKERRKLILCVRETPLSTIHLEQMHKLSLAGAVLMPVSPSFYLGADSVRDLAGHFADRVIALIDPTYQPAGWKQESL